MNIKSHMINKDEVIVESNIYIKTTLLDGRNKK